MKIQVMEDTGLLISWIADYLFDVYLVFGDQHVLHTRLVTGVLEAYSFVQIVLAIVESGSIIVFVVL